MGLPFIAPAEGKQEERTWLVEETCTYTVKAVTRVDAEEKFLAHGPAITPSGEQHVRFDGVSSRTIEEAD